MFICIEILRSVYLRRDTAQCLSVNTVCCCIMVVSYMLSRGYFDISSPDLIRPVGVRSLGSVSVSVKVN